MAPTTIGGPFALYGVWAAPRGKRGPGSLSYTHSQVRPKNEISPEPQALPRDPRRVLLPGHGVRREEGGGLWLNTTKPKFRSMNTDDIVEGLKHLGTALDLMKKGHTLWKALRGSQATPEQEAKVDKLFKDAEMERQLALASIGKAFNYQLCRCTVPPQVCTRTGYDRLTGGEQSKCPNCGQKYPEELDPLPASGELGWHTE